MKTTKKTGPQAIKRIVVALASAGLASLPQLALANPEGGQVVAGTAAIRQETPNKVAVTQTTAKAIVDWRSFNIGANEQVQFYQPSTSSVTLNRVLGEDPSKILGRLTANGQVFLVNPNGIYFGKGSQIDVAGLVASTHNIKNEDFLAGKYLFNIQGKPGAAVINEGTIHIADTGIAAFVAPAVANRGVIVAKLGKIALAAANGFTLDFTGDELLTFLVSDEVAKTAFDVEGKPLTSFVENSGTIEAQGGYVLLTAKAAENAIHGVINQNGAIEATTVGTHNGEIILNAGKGSLNVSGTLDASAPNGGDGGFIETSGSHVTIDPNAKITTTAPYGKYGTWLIDPNDFTIASAGGNITGASLSSSLANNNVTIQTATAGTPGGNGDIFVNDSVAWSANTQLVLQAERHAHINNNITATGSGSDFLVNILGTVYVPGNVTAGRVRYWANDADLTGTTRSLSNNISICPNSGTTPVRIANNHIQNALNLTPSELATLASPFGIYVGYDAHSNDLTVSASLDSSSIHGTGGLTLAGRNVTINSPISLTSPNSPVRVSASDTLSVNANVSGTGAISTTQANASVEYIANSMALSGITTALDSTIWIGTYDRNRPIRIESTPTTGALSLTPAELATLHVNPNTFDSIALSTDADITVTAALTGNQIGSRDFLLWTIEAGKITIDAPISGGERLKNILLEAKSDITINAPISPIPQVISHSGVIKYYDSQVLTPAQQQLVNAHKNDNPAMLLIAIGNGLFSNSLQDPVWVGMYQNGSASPAQVIANSLWPTYDKYRTAAASTVLEGLKNGDIVYGGTIWVALGSSNQANRNAAYDTFSNPTNPSNLTAAQQKLVDAHKNDSTFQLLTAIADGLFTNSNTDPIWVALYQNGAATAVQVEANRLRNIYDKYTAEDIFALIRSGQLHNDSNDSTWHSIYRNGRATPAQVEANGFANTYNKYQHATGDTLFYGLVSEDLSLGNVLHPLAVVWEALVQQNLSGTNKALQMWWVFQVFRGGPEDKLLEGLVNGGLVYGSAVWTALGTTNLKNRDAAYYTFTHPAPAAPALTVEQQKLVTLYKDRPADQLFWGLVSTDPLQQLKNDPTDPVWRALYVGGRATQSQKDADAYKRIFDTYHDAGPDRLLQALKSGALNRQGIVWEALTDVNEYNTRSALANYMAYLANNSQILPYDPTRDISDNSPQATVPAPVPAGYLPPLDPEFRALFGQAFVDNPADQIMRNAIGALPLLDQQYYWHVINLFTSGKPVSVAEFDKLKDLSSQVERHLLRIKGLYGANPPTFVLELTEKWEAMDGILKSDAWAGGGTPSRVDIGKITVKNGVDVLGKSLSALETMGYAMDVYQNFANGENVKNSVLDLFVNGAGYSPVFGPVLAGIQVVDMIAGFTGSTNGVKGTLNTLTSIVTNQNVMFASQMDSITTLMAQGKITRQDAMVQLSQCQATAVTSLNDAMQVLARTDFVLWQTATGNIDSGNDLAKSIRNNEDKFSQVTMDDLDRIVADKLLLRRY